MDGIDKITEKERELVKLRTNLELLQEEKDNLQDDLLEEIEKNKSLEKKLILKSKEVTRLRNEVYSLENRSLPHNEDIDIKETQKILQTKIKDLEQVIDQNYKEINELQQERDSDKEQVNKVETQCKNWLDKFIEADQKLQTLSELMKVQEVKYNSLQEHCNELEAYLKELRPSCSNEESLMDESFQYTGNTNRRSNNFDPLIACEDLAHSVVDVQLKEKEKENEEIKTTLDIIMSENGILETQVQHLNSVIKQKEEFIEELTRTKAESISLINNMNIEICNLTKNIARVQSEFGVERAGLSDQLEKEISEKKDILEQLDIQISENRSLTDKLKQCQLELDRVNAINIQITENLVQVSKQMQETSQELTKTISEKSTLFEEINKVKIELEVMAATKNEVLVDLNANISKNSSLTDELKCLQEEKHNISEELNSARTEIFSLRENISQLQEHMEKIAIDKNSLMAKLENVLLDNKHVIEELDQKNLQISLLNQNLGQCQEKFDKAHEENLNISNELEKTIIEKKNMFDALNKTLCENSALLENVKYLQESLEELSMEKINLMGQLDRVVLDKEKVVEELDEKRLQISLQHENFLDCERQLDNAKAENSNLTHNLENMLEENQEILEALERTVCEKSTLSENIGHLQENLEKIVLEKNSITEQMQISQEELVRVVKENSGLVELLEKTECDKKKIFEQLSREMLEKSSLIVELETASKRSNEFQEENSHLKDNFEKTIKEKEELILRNGDLINTLDVVRQENHNVMGNLNKVKGQYLKMFDRLKVTQLELERIILEDEKSIEKLCEERDAALESTKQMSAELAALRFELDKITQDKSTICEKYIKFEIQYKELHNEKLQLAEKVMKQELENDHLSCCLLLSNAEMADVIEELGYIREDRSCIANKLNELTLEKDVLMKSYQVLQSELDKAVLEKSQIKEEVERSSQAALEKINKMEQYLVTTENSKLELEFAIYNTKQELDEVSDTLANTLLDKSQLKEELVSIKVQLKKVTEENEEHTLLLEKANANNKKLYNKLEDAHKEITEMKLEKCNIAQQYESTKHQLENTLSEKNKIYDDSVNISKKLSMTLSELTDLSAFLENLKLEKNQLHMQLEELSRDLELKQQLLKDHQLIQIQLEHVIDEKIIQEGSYESRKLELGSVITENDLTVVDFNRLFKKLSYTFTELQQLSDKLSEVRNEKDSIYNELQKVKLEKQAVTEDLKKYVDENCKLIENLEKVTEERNQIQQVLDIVNAEKCGISVKFSVIAQEKVNIQQVLDETVLEKVKIQQKLENCELENEKLNIEKCELSESLSKTTKELERVFEENYKLIEHSKKISEQFASDNCKLLEEFDLLRIERNNILEKITELVSSRDKIFEEFKVAKENFQVHEKLLSGFLSGKLLVWDRLRKLKDNLENVISQNIEVGVEELMNSIDIHVENYIKNDVNPEDYILDQLIQSESKILKIVDVLEGMIIKYVEKFDNLKQEVMNLTEEKALVSNFLDLNNNELQKVIQEKEDILNALEMSNKEVENIAQEKQLIQEQLVIMTEDCEKLRTDKSYLDNQIVELRRQLSSLSDELQIINETKINLTEQFERVSREKADFSVLLDKALQKENETLKTLNEKSEQIEKLEKELDSKVQEIKQLEKLMQDNSEKLSKISQENNDILEIVESFSQEKLHLNSSLEHAREELARYSLEKTELSSHLDAVTRELEVISMENHNLVQSLEIARLELQKVKKERNEILANQTELMRETETNIRLAHESAVDVKVELSKRIETAEREKKTVKKQLENELQKIREAYSKVVGTNSKLELEVVNLRREIEEMKVQMKDYMHIKDAYEKLLEENNRLITDVDTCKYKRSRDRDEFVRILKKERQETDARETKKIRDVRMEYEDKLEKMKEKMLKLFREEVNKEIVRVKEGRSGSIELVKEIQELKSELFDAEQKILTLELQLKTAKLTEMEESRGLYRSRESLRSLDKRVSGTSASITSLRAAVDNELARDSVSSLMRKVKSASTMQETSRDRLRNMTEYRPSTLPRTNVLEVEETVTVSRRTSLTKFPTSIGQNIEMEDEDDDFNNKYLADMKAGRCGESSQRESNARRVSQLAWRNSLVPPHLKSSYPAELQFVSPTHFKEDDIKSGHVELDDSLCKLLPGEKPRQKKDFGTTSYKKPGPPTPSKNGGRLSLQGNEVQPLRDHNEKSPKKAPTPSRIRALFMGRTSLKENSDSQTSTTPKTSKRLSIFRKQR